MTTHCPCCGSSVERPVIVSLDTNTISSPLGSVHVKPKTAEMLDTLVKKFPGSVRNDALGVAMWGNGYWDIDRNTLGVHVSIGRKILRPLGLEIVNCWNVGYRLSANPKGD